MRKIVLILIFLSSILFAGKLEIDIDGQNKIYDALISIKNKNPLYVYKLLNQSNTEGSWETENYKYVYKLKISDGDKIGIFIITEIKKPDFWLVKKLNMKSGYILLIDANIESKIVWKGNAKSYDSCKAPLYANLFNTITPTCKQRWDMYSYFNANKMFQSRRSGIVAKMNGTNDGHFAVQAALHVVEFELDPIGKLGSEATKLAINQTLSALAPDGNAEVNEIMAGILADVAMSSIKGVASPLTLLKDQSFKISGMFNDLYGAFNLDGLIEELNELLISSCYLKKYYEFGGDNGKVANNYGIPYNSSLWDTINAVAQSSSCGSNSNNWYGTEYDINNIQTTVENLKYNGIPRHTQKCLKGGCN